MNIKDNFSQQAATYAKFRPTYPLELLKTLLPLVSERENVWDCGCGNGQLSVLLSNSFSRVYATDISTKQLENAVNRPNILYQVSAAEHTTFPTHFFDCITVAQAVHWFNFEQFYAEVRRVARPNAILALIGYPLLTAKHDAINNLLQHFYKNIIGAYWDKERHFIDEKYQTIPFPFEEMLLPDCYMEYTWDFETMIGYLNSWSSVQHYIKQHHENPIDLIYNDLKKYFDESHHIVVQFEIIKRIGKVF